MMKKPAYERLVRLALEKGYTISVWDGEEWAVKRGASAQEILDAIESVEEAELRIHDAKRTNWVLVTAYGVAHDETIIDHSVSKTLEDLMEQIKKG